MKITFCFMLPILMVATFAFANEKENTADLNNSGSTLDKAYRWIENRPDLFGFSKQADEGEDLPAGDINNDRICNLADLSLLINSLYRDGKQPVDSNQADINCDNIVNIRDIVTLVSYLQNPTNPLPICNKTP
jgi:hypothetical protein